MEDSPQSSNFLDTSLYGMEVRNPIVTRDFTTSYMNVNQHLNTVEVEEDPLSLDKNEVPAVKSEIQELDENVQIIGHINQVFSPAKGIAENVNIEINITDKSLDYVKELKAQSILKELIPTSREELNVQSMTNVLVPVIKEDIKDQDITNDLKSTSQVDFNDQDITKYITPTNQEDVHNQSIKNYFIPSNKEEVSIVKYEIAENIDYSEQKPILLSVKTENIDEGNEAEHEQKLKLNSSLMPILKIERNAILEKAVADVLKKGPQEKKELQELKFDSSLVSILEIEREIETGEAVTELIQNRPQVNKQLQEPNFDLSLVPILKIERNIQLEKAVAEIVKNRTQSPQRIGDKGTLELTEDADTVENNEDFGNPVGFLALFVCIECNLLYKRKEILDAHVCKKNPSERMYRYINNTNKVSFVNKSENIIKQHSTNSDSNKHKKIHIKYSNNDKSFCKICGVTLKASLLPYHLNSHLGNKTFICDMCGKSFKTKYGILYHFQIHYKDQKNYTCVHCKKSFWDKNVLTKHLFYRCEKPKGKLYHCSECPKAYILRGYLKTHMLQHQGVRPLVCHICGDTFRDKKCLKIHFLKHSGEKPYQCNFCSKKFKQLPHRVRHERLHTGVKPYTCKVCGKKFRDSSNMKVHMISHTGDRPFKCDLCDKDFTQRSHLKTHKTTHSDSRPFSCDICGGRFKERNVLKSHILLHSDVKPYNCEICRKSFVQMTAFKRHKCY